MVAGLQVHATTPIYLTGLSLLKMLLQEVFIQMALLQNHLLSECLPGLEENKLAQV